jgi:hypothetical protein
MPYSLDTSLLKIRDVFALNSKTGAFIEYDSFPVIRQGGTLTWNTPSEFLGGISCLNTTVLGVLESIQPGLSTLSTNFTRYLDSVLSGAVNGYPYVSSTTLIKTFNDLGSNYGYISKGDFYNCVKGLNTLGSLTYTIPTMILFLQAVGSNFAPSGYVGTAHPGGFHNYYSTLGFTGGLTNANIGGGIQSLSLDLGGFEFLDSSKMRLDIYANVTVTYTSPETPVSFATFLYNGAPVGTPVVVNYTNLTFTISKFTYFLTAADLSPSLTLRHSIQGANAQITVLPISVSARLINMD